MLAHSGAGAVKLGRQLILTCADLLERPGVPGKKTKRVGPDAQAWIGQNGFGGLCRL